VHDAETFGQDFFTVWWFRQQSQYVRSYWERQRLRTQVLKSSSRRWKRPQR